jgi:signal transduction histidine kinase
MLTSLRVKLRLMLILLGCIIPLMLLNYYMNQVSSKLDRTLLHVNQANKLFTDNLAGELSAIGNAEKLPQLKRSYRTLYNSCIQCHEQNPGIAILERNSLLKQLQENQLNDILLRQTLNANLNQLSVGVKYIHEHHIATLKNLLSRNQIQEDAYPEDFSEKKQTSISAPELDIIQETVTIQNILADIIRNFYVLKDSDTPLALQTAFFHNIKQFYSAINIFESYSLDAQDGLLVEELLGLGKTFEDSFAKLLHSEELDRTLLQQLQENQLSITRTFTQVNDIIKSKHDRVKSYLHFIAYASFVCITLLIFLIIKKGNIIIKTINRLVAETAEIKKNYKYRIEDNDDSEEEFRILSKALNSMAKNLDERIQTLNKEVELRMTAEQKKAETEINLQRAEQMSAIGTLAGGIAHDFNNLLTAILGNINIATYSLSPNHTVYNNLVDAEKASKRAHKLTKQLLTFSKGGGPVKETAPISEVIRESAFFILHGSNVDCRIDIPDNLWLVTIDKGQIGQVIQNLTLNADHAMPDGGVIRIRCENYTAKDDSPILDAGKYVQVTVQDQGKGIKKNDLAKIFDPYFTTKEKGNIKGSGLGLAIVQSIISRHGGHISAEAGENAGTTFTFFLPASSSTQVEQQEINGDILFGEGKILVMDDESMILEMMKQSLPSLGYMAETADSGEQALVMYNTAAKNNAPFSLVIMDLTIPGGMGGKETAEKLLAKHPDAILLVSSGYAEDPIMMNPTTYGFKGALKKPYELRELSHLLHELLM